MPIDGDEDPQSRATAVTILAEGLIAELGERAAELAERQARESSGEIRQSWIMIAEAIAELSQASRT